MNELVTELYGVAYSLPSENSEWVERQGNTVPMNACTRAGDEIERLMAEVERLRAAAQSAIDGYAKGDDVLGPMQKLRAAVQQQSTSRPQCA